MAPGATLLVRSKLGAPVWCACFSVWHLLRVDQQPQGHHVIKA
jgi:hypothetical protein